MPDKLLVEHIKGRIRAGHDITKVRDQLLKSGHSYFDVHEAIDIAFRDLANLSRDVKEIKQEIKKEEATIIKIIKPSANKFILPIIILLMLLMHFLGNVVYLPGIGETLCENAKLKASLESGVDKRTTEIPDLQKQAWEKEAFLIEKFKGILNFNFLLIGSRAYRFDPFFPAPCEIRSFIEAEKCVFYMTRENYECIKLNNPGILNGELPDYKQVTGPIIIFNSLLLLIQYYIINCFAVYFYDKSKQKMTAEKKEAIRIAIIITILLLLILSILAYIYVLNIISTKFG